jgi:hypothetical protein
MSDVKKILEKSNLIAFVGGAVAAAIVPGILRSAPVRKAAVCAVAKGMKLQEDAIGAFEEIREDAQDIYCEAKDRAKGGASCASEEEQEA